MFLKQEVNKIILLFLVLLLLSFSVLATPPVKVPHLKVSLHYVRDAIILNNVEIIKVDDVGIVNEGDYRLELISTDNKSLYETYFDFFINEEISIEDGADKELVDFANIERQDREEKYIIVPYFTNVKKIRIYDTKNTLKLSENIERFINGCGNFICEKDLGETPQNCPQDCSEQPKIGNYIIYSALLIVIVIAIIFPIYLRNRNKPRIPQPPMQQYQSYQTPQQTQWRR